MLEHTLFYEKLTNRIPEKAYSGARRRTAKGLFLPSAGSDFFAPVQVGPLHSLPTGNVRHLHRCLHLLTVPRRHLRLASWQNVLQRLPCLCPRGVPAAAARELGRVRCLQALLHSELSGRVRPDNHHQRPQHNGAAHDAKADRGAHDDDDPDPEHHDHPGADDAPAQRATDHDRRAGDQPAAIVRRRDRRFLHHRLLVGRFCIIAASACFFPARFNFSRKADSFSR